MWSAKDKLGYRVSIPHKVLVCIDGLCYNRGNTKANERLCMKIEVKQIYSEDEVYVQWDNRCSVCWLDQTPLCNNANCDGVRN